MAVTARHRTMMVAVGNRDVMRALINLLSSTKEKVKCQACLALRNLATDSKCIVYCIYRYSHTDKTQWHYSEEWGNRCVNNCRKINV